MFCVRAVDDRVHPRQARGAQNLDWPLAVRDLAPGVSDDAAEHAEQQALRIIVSFEQRRTGMAPMFDQCDLVGPDTRGGDSALVVFVQTRICARIALGGLRDRLAVGEP